MNINENIFHGRNLKELQIIFKISLGVEINVMNYLFLVVIFTIAYIFKYGHEIQLDSKGRIYGDENE